MTPRERSPPSRAPDVRRRLALRLEGALPGRRGARARAACGPVLGAGAAGPLRLGPRAGSALSKAKTSGSRWRHVRGARAPPSIAIRERIARLGDRETPLRRAGAVTAARTCSSACHAAATSSRRWSRPSRTRSGSHAPSASSPAGSLLVYPRLVELEALFSETGAHAQDGRRMLLRRPSASTCTPCASTSTASRCARCTGARRRSADS